MIFQSVRAMASLSSATCHKLVVPSRTLTAFLSLFSVFLKPSFVQEIGSMVYPGSRKRRLRCWVHPNNCLWAILEKVTETTSVISHMGEGKGTRRIVDNGVFQHDWAVGYQIDGKSGANWLYESALLATFYNYLTWKIVYLLGGALRHDIYIHVYRDLTNSFSIH